MEQNIIIHTGKNQKGANSLHLTDGWTTLKQGKKKKNRQSKGAGKTSINPSFNDCETGSLFLS
jgi:hypothetical protein